MRIGEGGGRRKGEEVEGRGPLRGLSVGLGLLVYLFVYGSNRVDVGSVRYTQVAEGHGPLRRDEENGVVG